MTSRNVVTFSREGKHAWTWDESSKLSGFYMRCSFKKMFLALAEDMNQMHLLPF